MESPLNILLIGASGRLGKEIEKVALHFPNFHIIEKITRKKPTLSNLDAADVILDVSLPHTLEQNLGAIIEAKKPLVLGTTGHAPEMLHEIKNASYEIPILHCPNFAPGMGVIKKMLSHFPDLVSAEIHEVHHTEKKDSPSGTAIELAKLTKTPHENIKASRSDDVFGNHCLKLTFEDEEVEITHKALSRSLFAKGALKACQYLSKKGKGLYTRPHD